jgi:hypothetical protein
LSSKFDRKIDVKIALDSRPFRLKSDLTGAWRFASPASDEHNLPIWASRFDSTQKQDAPMIVHGMPRAPIHAADDRTPAAISRLPRGADRLPFVY